VNISKPVTVDDIYMFDDYISTPGVREGLLERAMAGEPDFIKEETDSGTAIYYRAPHGEIIGLGRPPAVEVAEPSLEGLQLAAGPSQTRTDAPQGFASAEKATGVTLPIQQQQRELYATGEATAADKTNREKLASFLTDSMVNLGADRFKTRERVESFIGGASSRLPLNLGLADFVPFLGTFLQSEEAAILLGQAKKSAERGDVKSAVIEGVGGTLGLVPGAIGTAKLTKKAVQELGPTAGKMAEDYLRKTGGLMDVAPGKFNPTTELPKAVDTVATNPDLKIYLPQAQRAPSVALRLAGVPIDGTGQKGTITVNDVGIILEKSQLALNKNKPLDPTKPKDLAKMVDSATAEAEYQMSQPISGATWYEDDVHQAFMLGSKIIPELATDEPLRVMTTAFSASTSYNKRAGENWPVALRITEHLMKTGQMASRNPDNGKLWGGTTGPIMEQQLKLHDYMIKRMGMDKYAEWLLTPHTVKEIIEMRAASGLYKSPGIPGKANDMKMGAFIMGEKGGPFFLNLNGIKETTADKWFTRTYNRHTGTLTQGNVSEQGLVDAPRNEAERAIMKQWNRAVASNIKLDEQANQAVLWYYEQSLYYNLGVKSARSESFSDGAKNLLNARGIPFDESELAGARNLRNARQTPTESTGTGGAGNPISVGQTTPAAGTTVTRGRRAPTKGAQ
jgi:hypothetical protein